MAVSRVLQEEFARITAEGRWVRVDSSNLDAVCYVPGGTGNLWIRFRSGSVYVYQYVEPGTYQGLLGAASKGKYHWRNIRNVYAVYRVF